MNFDLLAAHYRWMEAVLAGNKLQRCRTTFLAQVPQAHNILILGEGNGRFLIECRRTFRDAKITVVDASSKMLVAAQNRLRSSGLNFQSVNFIHADALSWKPAALDYDLVVTHFFLDCFTREQLASLINKISRSLLPDATWLLADFQIPKHGLRKFRARIIHALMYFFFRVVTRLPARKLECPDEFLAAQGFVREKQELSDWGLLHSDLWRRATYSPPLAMDTSARSKSCNVIKPMTFPSGPSCKITMCTGDSISKD